MRPARALGFALILAVTGCFGDDDILDPTEIDFADSLDIDLAAMTRTASGLYIEDVTVGTGAIAATGDEVIVHYSGWLPNGTLFGSQDASNPLVVTLGADDLIQGFREGVTGMRVGGVRKLVIPPALGYGGQTNGPIPPNSTLVFQVELIGID